MPGYYIPEEEQRYRSARDRFEDLPEPSAAEESAVIAHQLIDALERTGHSPKDRTSKGKELRRLYALLARSGETRAASGGRETMSAPLTNVTVS